jgi:hypothetical protein
VDRKDDFRIATGRQCANGVAHRPHRLTVTFAAVQGEQDPTRARAPNGGPAPPRTLDRPEQRVDHGVPRHVHPFVGDGFGDQVLSAAACRAEVQRGDPRHDAAVELFGERCVAIPGSQAGLDVRDRGHLVEAGQRSAHRRRCISLHDDPVGRELAERLAETAHELGRQIREPLLRPHHTEVQVGRELELREHLIEQLAVLPGGDHDRLCAARPP